MNEKTTIIVSVWLKICVVPFNFLKIKHLIEICFKPFFVNRNKKEKKQNQTKV